MQTNCVLDAFYKLSIVTALIIQAHVATARDPDRSIVEARALLRVVLAEETRQRCKYPADWAKEPVPEGLAAKFFGLTVRADLLGPEVSEKISGVVDPQHTMADAFCDEAELKDYEEKHTEELRNVMSRDKSAEGDSIETTSFSFPIFDASYRKAAIVVSHYNRSVERLRRRDQSEKPKIVLMPGEGHTDVEFYQRTQKGWQLIAREQISTT